MAFDAIELLNAFDIIKNETRYSQRLQKLADAQAELSTSEYIVQTVEIAQARLEEANRLLAQYRSKIENLDKEIEDTRTKRFADVVALEKALDTRKKDLDKLTGSLNQQRQVLQYDQTQLVKDQKALQHSIDDYDQRRLEINKKAEYFTSKLEQLRKVIES